MYLGSGEKAQPLRTLSDLPADPGSIPGTHNMDHNLLLHQSKVIQHPLWPPRPLHVHGAEIYACKTPIHMYKNSFKN